MKSKEKKDRILMNIKGLSYTVRKLTLYTSFNSKSKNLDQERIRDDIASIKVYIENLDNILNN